MQQPGKQQGGCEEEEKEEDSREKFRDASPLLFVFHRRLIRALGSVV